MNEIPKLAIKFDVFHNNYITGEDGPLTRAQAQEGIRRVEAYPKLKKAVDIAIKATLPHCQTPQLSIEKLQEITEALGEQP